MLGQVGQTVTLLHGAPHPTAPPDPALMTGRYHPDDVPRLEAIHRKIEREEPKRGSYAVELRYRHKQGHYIWIRSNFKRTYQPDGAFESVGVWMDITEQKQAEIALRLSEERFHRLAENIPGTVFEIVQRADGRYAMPYMNRNGIDNMGRANYIVTRYFSVAVTTPDALGVLENVHVEKAKKP